MRSVWRLLPLVALRRGLFLETVVWGALAQVAVLAVSLGLAFMVGHVAAGEGKAPNGLLWALGAAAVLIAAAAWRESWVSHDLAYVLLGALRGRVFDVLRRALPARRQARRSGDLVTTVLGDVETLEWLYAHSAAQVFSAGLLLAVSAVVSWMVTPLLLLVWVPLLALSVVVSLRTRARATRDGESIARGAAVLRAEVLDTARGIEELSAAAALDRQWARVSELTRRVGVGQHREATRLGGERAVTDAALALAVLGAVLVVAVRVDALPVAQIPLAITAAIGGLMPAAQLVELWRGLGVLRASAQRVAETLDLPPAVHDVAVAAPQTPGVPSVGLEFDRVCFGFDGTTVLRDVSFHVRPGEVVALVGESGAGKSTAANLALRLWDVDAGAVRIDGVDVRAMDDPLLRRKIAVVPQGAPLLRGTVRSNILLGVQHASEEEVQAAAEAAGLLDPRSGLPAGLDTPVAEHGEGVSGGQRARVAIARALLGRPCVLVLDEPTAALDADADAAVMEFLTRPNDCATLVIAHRPQTIAAAHRVIRFIAHGSVV